MPISKQKAITFFLLFSVSFFTSSAQKRRDTARENIVLLKSGALFVRLKTSTLKINALKESGNIAEAEEMRVNQENENKAIIAAFKNNFTFCPVYFFYSNNSNEVKAGNYKGMLLNVNNQTDSTFNNSNYLIGEFDASANTQIAAFIIKNKNYEQLEPPFPFLIKQNQALVSTRSNDAIVSLLDKKLIAFYGK